MRQALVLGSILICSVVTQGRAQSRAAFDRAAFYEIPPFHSQIEFAVPFMGLATVRGAFEDFEGRAFIHPSRPDSSAIVVVARAVSIHTGIAMRDKHLRSSDFLDVERFPLITFQSDRISRTPSGFVVEGRLTLHGVTRTLAVPFRSRHAPMLDEDGLVYAGYDAEFMLNWRDFGIAATNQHNPWFQPAKMLVSDSLRVILSFEAEHRQRFDRQSLKATRAAFDSAASELLRTSAAKP